MFDEPTAHKNKIKLGPLVQTYPFFGTPKKFVLPGRRETYGRHGGTREMSCSSFSQRSLTKRFLAKVSTRTTKVVEKKCCHCQDLKDVSDSPTAPSGPLTLPRHRVLFLNSFAGQRQSPLRVSPFAFRGAVVPREVAPACWGESPH